MGDSGLVGRGVSVIVGGKTWIARIRKGPVRNIEEINMPNEFELDVWRELELGIDTASCRDTSGKSGEFEGLSLLTESSGGSLG